MTDAQAWPGETELVDDAGPVRQGDVFSWEHQQAPWALFGVIVTADCDIAREKHAGILSYVPVLPIEDYWRIFILPKRIETQLAEKTWPLVRGTIAALQARHQPGYSELSPSAMDDMVRDQEPPQAMEALGVPEPDRHAPIRLLHAYRTARSLRESAPIHELAAALAELREVSKKKPGVADASTVLDELANAVHQLPGDAFFIGQIVPATHGANVAFLRTVREMKTTDLAAQPKDLKAGALARRVARLRSPFVYRLTQQLGAVFADIGLPTEYELERAKRAAGVRAALPNPPVSRGDQP